MLNEYFGRSDTPSENSPVGELMKRIVAKFPGISFEDARSKAKGLLLIAAGKRVYRTPVVLTEQQRLAQKERLARAFPKTAILGSTDRQIAA